MGWKLVVIAQLLAASALAYPTPVRVYDPQMTPANYDVREAGSLESQPSVQPYLQSIELPSGISQSIELPTGISQAVYQPSPSIATSQLFTPSSSATNHASSYTKTTNYAPNQAYAYTKTLAKYVAPQFPKPGSFSGLGKDNLNSQYDGYNGYNAEVQPITYNQHSGVKTFETNAGREELNDGLVAFYKNPLVNSHSSVRALKMFDMHPAFKDAMNVDAYYDMSILALPKGFGESFYGYH